MLSNNSEEADPNPNHIVLKSIILNALVKTSIRQSKERIKSKINSKDPVLEILDEDDDYEKPIIIGVAKK